MAGGGGGATGGGQMTGDGRDESDSFPSPPCAIPTPPPPPRPLLTESLPLVPSSPMSPIWICRERGAGGGERERETTMERDGERRGSAERKKERERGRQRGNVSRTCGLATLVARAGHWSYWAQGRRPGRGGPSRGIGPGRAPGRRCWGSRSSGCGRRRAGQTWRRAAPRTCAGARLRGLGGGGDAAMRET